MSKIGIALGGGGARGLAHIGVIRALRDRQELVPSIVAGTSAGSIIAALFSAGVAQKQIEAEIRNFEWFRDVVSVQNTFKNFAETKSPGLVSNEKLEETVNELIAGRGFDQLARELAVVATDIDAQERVIFIGKRSSSRIKERFLTEFLPPPADMRPGVRTVIVSDFQNVGRAVAASCAIPGLFQPVTISGRRLVDGALVDQVPVDVVRAMGASPVIGVSLSFAMFFDKVNRATSLVNSMISLLGIQQLRKSLDLADIGFQIPGIEKKSIFDTHQLELIDEGEIAMKGLLPELDRLLRNPLHSLISRSR